MKRIRLSLVGLLGLALVLVAVQPAPGTATAAGAALLPDLQMERPFDPRINVDQQGQHLLKFGTDIANVGAGRLQIHLVKE